MRRSASIWRLLPSPVVDRGLAQLRADLESGRWDERYGELRTLDSLDIGLRLVTADLA